MSSGLGGTSGPMFVTQLFNAGLLSNKQFGFHLSGLTGISYVDLGYINPDSMRDPQELVWLSVVNNSFFWKNYITGVWVPGSSSGTALKDGFSLTQVDAIVDTGTSCSYFPTRYY